MPGFDRRGPLGRGPGTGRGMGGCLTGIGRRQTNTPLGPGRGARQDGGLLGGLGRGAGRGAGRGGVLGIGRRKGRRGIF